MRGEVTTWPTHGPQTEVQLKVESNTVILRPMGKQTELGGVAPSNDLQVWGCLRCEGDALILEVERLERVQS